MTRLTHALRLVVVSSSLSYRALFNWAGPPMFVSTLLVAPSMQMIFFLYLGRQLRTGSDAFYIVGNAVLGCSVACVYGCTMAIANERRFGTLGAVLLSPRRRLLLWLPRALPYILNGLLVSCFTLGVGALAFGLRVSPDRLLALLPVLAAAAYSCAAFGLVLGAIGIRLRDVFLLSNLSATIMLVVTGTNVPRSALPGPLAALGTALPPTHAVDAAHALFAGGSGSTVVHALIGELLVGTAYLVAAALLMRYFESASRRRAAIDTL